jgi:hypothetical protein
MRALAGSRKQWGSPDLKEQRDNQMLRVLSKLRRGSNLSQRIHPLLSPAIYDRREREAIARLPVPVLMAFRPVTFQLVGYPIHVEQEAELLRYADHNFEAEVPGLFRPGATFPPIAYVNAFTRDECDLLTTVRDRVAGMTARRFGRSVRPVTNLMVQMGPFRILHEIARVTGQRRLDVFEPGPGMGYLGALLSLAGHRYMSFDVTQSLYLWQNRMLEAVADKEFVENATASVGPSFEAGQVVHLPWWQYVDLLWSCPVRADIVYSNSNLGEMSLLALKHVLHISRAMLAQSQLGLFMYMSTGMLAQNSAESIATEFAQFGYRKICDTPFVGYVLGNRDASAILAAFRNGVPHYSPNGMPATLEAHEVMALTRAEAPLDADLCAWNYGCQFPFTG